MWIKNKILNSFQCFYSIVDKKVLDFESSISENNSTLDEALVSAMPDKVDSSLVNLINLLYFSPDMFDLLHFSDFSVCTNISFKWLAEYLIFSGFKLRSFFKIDKT
jgi:hypothetical protein